jgi:4-amino-4-deoxy-L-arabinose transferase-like glycosyltransferase
MNGRLLAIMLLATMLTWSAQWHWSQTIDEPQHLWAGLRIVQQWDFSRFDNSKMPVSSLNAVGWLLSQSPGVQGSWFFARAPQVVWLLGTVGLVFVWAKRLGGAAAALGAAALVAFDPNLVAHAGLVTTDLPCTFAVLFACFTWARLMDHPSRTRAVAAGAALGFALAAKFTGLFLVPIVGIIVLLWCWLRRTTAPIRQIPLAVLAGFLTLNLCYGFSGSFTPANEIQWKSQPFSVLSSVAFPLPVPRPWIEGVDWVKHDDDQGQGRVYASGERSHFGKSDHYLRTLPRKWPLPLMLLGLAGLVVAVRRRDEDPAKLLGVVVPPVFFLLWFSLAFNSQVGNRYLLPVVPFLALWAARLPPRWLAAGAGWTLVSALSWWPWGLSYFNETVTDRSQAWRIVADSDLDWGQTNAVAEDWLAAHPGGFVDPDVPTPGAVLLSANRLTGVFGHPALMACYREHLPPTEHLAGALYPLVYAAEDFAPCFPVVQVEGNSGPYPAGAHLLLIRFRGSASLRVGTHVEQAHAEDEALLGVVIQAATPFSAEWVVPEGGTVYLNGVAIAGGEQP